MTRPPFARAGVQASAASGLDRRQLAEQLRHRAHPSVGRPRPDRQHPGALWAATRICPLAFKSPVPCVRSMIARRDGRESCGRATHGASRTPLYTRFAWLPDTFEDTDIYDAFAGPRRALSASRYRRVTRFCRRSVRGAPDGAISTRRQGWATRRRAGALWDTVHSERGTGMPRQPPCPRGALAGGTRTYSRPTAAVSSCVPGLVLLDAVVWSVFKSRGMDGAAASSPARGSIASGPL